MSDTPQLVDDEQHNERQAAPDEQDFFRTIVPNDRYVVVYGRIPVEELVALPPDPRTRNNKDDCCGGECHAQCRNPRVLDRCDQEYTVRLHQRRLGLRLAGLHCASVRFFDATEGGIGLPSLGRAKIQMRRFHPPGCPPPADTRKPYRSAAKTDSGSDPETLP